MFINPIWGYFAFDSTVKNSPNGRKSKQQPSFSWLLLRVYTYNGELYCGSIFGVSYVCKSSAIKTFEESRSQAHSSTRASGS
jgi:hypothetical protein